jgi:hypothetical protein
MGNGCCGSKSTVVAKDLQVEVYESQVQAQTKKQPQAKH